MIALIQRVTRASVTVEREIIGEIDTGLLVLLGVEPDDTNEVADKMIQKIVNYRVFSDQDGKMNLSVLEVNGNILLVPQFTLAANTQKGNRPSFTTAAPPALGKEIYDYCQSTLMRRMNDAKFGKFGADMKVSLVNDGPVTFLLHFSI